MKRKKDRIDGVPTECIQTVEGLYEEFAERMRQLLPNPWAQEELDRTEARLKVLRERIEERS